MTAVWHHDPHCSVCGLMRPPWMAGVPTECADDYCWGHGKEVNLLALELDLEGVVAEHELDDDSVGNTARSIIDYLIRNRIIQPPEGYNWHE